MLSLRMNKSISNYYFDCTMLRSNSYKLKVIGYFHVLMLKYFECGASFYICEQKVTAAKCKTNFSLSIWCFRFNEHKHRTRKAAWKQEDSHKTSKTQSVETFFHKIQNKEQKFQFFCIFCNILKTFRRWKWKQRFKFSDCRSTLYSVWK